MTIGRFPILILWVEVKRCEKGIIRLSISTSQRQSTTNTWVFALFRETQTLFPA